MSTDLSTAERAAVRSAADGGVIAQVRLDHENLLLRPTLGRATSVTVEPEYWTTLDTGAEVVYCTVYGDSFDTFEDALAVDHTVADPVLVDRYPDRQVYRLALTASQQELISPAASVCAHLLDIHSTPDGWVVELRFPSRDALVSFNEHCQNRDVRLQVNHLQVSDDDEDPVVGLTGKQESLLETAYEAGYFDVPRAITQDELAAKLGVSKSAISQRLRRAIAQLCAQSLAQPARR